MKKIVIISAILFSLFIILINENYVEKINNIKFSSFEYDMEQTPNLKAVKSMPHFHYVLNTIEDSANKRIDVAKEPKKLKSEVPNEGTAEKREALYQNNCSGVTEKGKVNAQDNIVEYADDSHKYDTSANKENQVYNKEKKYFLSIDEILAVNNISIRDKLFGLTIVGKLGKSNLDAIYNIIRGGITFDEAEELKEILQRKLNSHDIETIESLIERNKKLYAEGQLSR